MNGLRAGSRVWTRRGIAAFVVVAAAGAGGNGHGGEPLSITRVYGAGVHAYFTGDYLRCYDDLTETIQAGSRDPRTRYFRGLAALGLGRLDEAEADFSEGAQLEAEAAGNWPVSRSLERVQGHPRFQLERHRARARVAALQRARERESSLYGEGGGAGVIRDRIPAGSPSGAREERNPFAEDPGAGSAPVERGVTPEPMPTPSAPEPASETPAGGEAPPAAGNELQPEAERPAAEPAAVGAEAPADASPVELPGEGPAAVAEDPFGDQAPKPDAAPVPGGE